MDLKPLPFRSPLESYQQQAVTLLDGQCAGDPDALEAFHRNHPRFLDSKVVWLPKNLPESEIRNASLDIGEAQLAVARWYNFRDWPALTAYVNAVTLDGPVFEFESAVETVIDGDLAALQSLLRRNPELVHARSTRITHFDPPVHRSTLLHYVAANGVEGYRQRTPQNALDIARALLEAGAEVDALADLYGGRCTTMSLLVSSCHPAQAGLQVVLVNLLVDFGAAVEPRGEGRWTSPLMTALAFGYVDAAEALVKRGARIDNLASAVGLGRLADAERLLPSADAEARHRGTALAAQLGYLDILRLLVDAGEDVNRYNPEGHHPHSTPLHQATAGGHESVVRFLVDRGARLDLKDKIYQSPPLGWAIYCGKAEIENFLRQQGAKTAQELD